MSTATKPKNRKKTELTEPKPPIAEAVPEQMLLEDDEVPNDFEGVVMLKAETGPDRRPMYRHSRLHGGILYLNPIYIPLARPPVEEGERAIEIDSDEVQGERVAVTSASDADFAKIIAAGYTDLIDDRPRSPESPATQSDGVPPPDSPPVATDAPGDEPEPSIDVAESEDAIGLREWKKLIKDVNVEVQKLSNSYESKKKAASDAKKALEAQQTYLSDLIAKEDECCPLFDRKPAKPQPAPAVVPAVIKPDDAWRNVPIHDALHGLTAKSIENLEAAGISTVGQLSDWSSKGKRLIDIDGIGEATADKIDDAMAKFWANRNTAMAAEIVITGQDDVTTEESDLCPDDEPGDATSVLLEEITEAIDEGAGLPDPEAEEAALAEAEDLAPGEDDDAGDDTDD